MKKMIFLLLAVLGTVAVFAQSGIRFEDGSLSFDEIIQKAKNENKIIFVDCYTTWCGPCKWMEKNVFPNDTVGDFYNQFICVSLDMQKGDGPIVAGNFEVSCFPTYLFINGDGKTLYRASGSCDVKGFIEIGRQALVPENQYFLFKEKYNAGNISKEELLTYMKLRERSCLSISQEKDEFFSLPSDDSDSLDWVVLRDFGVELHSFLFKIVVSSRDTLYILHGEEEVNRIIFNSYLEGMMKCLYGEAIDTVRYAKLKLELLELGLPSTQNFINDCDLSFYSMTREWDKFASTAVRYIESLPKNEEEYLGLNNIAYIFYENVEDSAYLNLALDWAKRSVELKKVYFNMDTYASILFKTGHKEEALKVAEEAVEMAKANGEDFSITQKLLDKIKGAM
ncbi:thioredoxin family protein [Patescibacteria group bacterium]|nr:thioredoxin family protein [Patescibacteria group bacterium]